MSDEEDYCNVRLGSITEKIDEIVMKKHKPVPHPDKDCEVEFLTRSPLNKPYVYA